jgi:hypothetical protein
VFLSLYPGSSRKASAAGIRKNRSFATIHVQNKLPVIEPVRVIIAAGDLQPTHGEITLRRTVN